MKEIYQFDRALKTCWCNPENINCAKGQGAKALGGRKGCPCIRDIKPGETRVLAQAEGRGMIRHIWITPEGRQGAYNLKGYRLEFFWDNSDVPAVSVPLGDFFCFNSGKVSPMENEFFSSPEGRSFNCYVPMPFKKGMKITLTNDTAYITEIQFFYQIDYTLGDDVDEALYFHAYYNREKKTALRRDYAILPKISGHGRFLGASFGVIANPLMAKSWWGEGEVKCYIDGDADWPTLVGTGVEDYIGTGYGMGRFINRYQGCTYENMEAMRYSFYRFHVCDPVYFSEDIRVTIQQMGCTGTQDLEIMLNNGLELIRTDGERIADASQPAAFDRFEDDWCSIAYFYLDKPSCDLPPIPPYMDRIESYQ